MLVTITRFSRNGFEPVFQDFLEQSIRHLLDTPLSAYPAHLRPYIEDAQSSVQVGWEQQLHGFWAFVGKVEDVTGEDSRFFLNHLTSAEQQARKWWSTALAGDTLVHLSCSALKAKPLPLHGVPLGSAIYVPVLHTSCNRVAV